MSISYSSLDILRCLIMVVLMSHWSACIWGIQAAPIFVEDPGPTWMGHLGYCVPADDGYDETMYTITRANSVCVDPGSMYVASLYWAFLLVTNTGYSNMFLPSTSTLEQLLSVIVMLISQTCWASVLATFTGIIIASNPHAQQFRHNMDHLNRFMRSQGERLPPAVQRRMREFLHQSRHLAVAASNRSLLEMMSPSLQGEVAWRTSERWLKRIVFLRSAEPAFMVQFSLALLPQVFAPGEIVPASSLYVIHRGIALYGGRVLTAGKVWGEDMILYSAHLRSRYIAKAMNYLEVYSISRKSLLAIAELYPETSAPIRRHQIFVALRRELIQQAKARLGVPLECRLVDRLCGTSTLDKLLSSATSKKADAASCTPVLKLLASSAAKPTPAESAGSGAAIQEMHAVGTPVVTPRPDRVEDLDSLVGSMSKRHDTPALSVDGGEPMAGIRSSVETLLAEISELRRGQQRQQAQLDALVEGQRSMRAGVGSGPTTSIREV